VVREHGGVVDGVSLPSGTVTFLFTDIEGSTRLWEEWPAEMAAAVERHDELLRGVIESNGGYVFTTAGDSFAAAFDRAEAAVVAATAAQDALAAERWSDAVALKVRMGLHTGEAFEREGDYFGPAVNRAARIMACGHGGQTLVSSMTAGLVGSEYLVDVGEHQLKDLDAPERLFQFGDGEFPDLRTAQTATHNLVPRAGRLVGRDLELGRLAATVERARLVTVVGPGGVGKTSLVTQLGTEMVDRFEDGVWLVDLAPVADPDLVATAIVNAIGLGAQAAGRHLELAINHLRSRRALLVVDNCEHLIDSAATVVGELVGACPELTVVATSREPLHLREEHVAPLDPLGVSEDNGGSGPAVKLFCERADMAGYPVATTAEADSAVQAICERLDGLPLAIELAAARLRSMSLIELNERLDQRFRLLTGGSRGVLPRQRTLEATVMWSYEQLDPATREVFDSVSVFAGGFGLAAAAFVCGLDEFDALDELDQLAARSLLTASRDTDGPTRYSMLETMRQFGRERLIEANAIDTMRDRHLSWLVGLVRDNEADVSLGIPAATQLIDAEIANIRVAVDWATQDPQRAVQGIELATRLGRYCYYRGINAEGASWIDSLMAAGPQLDPAAEAQLLSVLGYNLTKSGHPDRAFEIATDALELARRLGDATTLTSSLADYVGSALGHRPISELFELTREGLQLARELGGEMLIYRHTMQHTALHVLNSDVETAQVVCREALEEFGDSPSPHQAGHMHEIAGGWMALLSGDTTAARPYLCAGLRSYVDAGDPNCACHALEAVVWLLAMEGDAPTANSLLATVASIRAEGAYQRTDAEAFPHDRALEILGEEPHPDQHPRLFDTIPEGLDHAISLLE